MEFILLYYYWATASDLFGPSDEHYLGLASKNKTNLGVFEHVWAMEILLFFQ